MNKSCGFVSFDPKKYPLFGKRAKGRPHCLYHIYHFYRIYLIYQIYRIP